MVASLVTLMLSSVVSTALGGKFEAVGNTLSSIVANRADNIASEQIDRLVMNFNINKKLVNHHLQKAISSSCYFDLISICEECKKASKGNERDYLWLQEEITSLKGLKITTHH